MRQQESITEICEAFVDDLSVHSCNIDQHVEDLARTFAAIRKRNFKVAAKKIFMGY
jgi:hypothetical protein